MNRVFKGVALLYHFFLSCLRILSALSIAECTFFEVMLVFTSLMCSLNDCADSPCRTGVLLISEAIITKL